MTTEINHLYSATIEGVSFTVDEARDGESISESSGSITVNKTYHLQTETPVNILTVRTLFNLFVRLSSRTKYRGLPITSMNVTHPEEEDLDKFWQIDLEYSGNSEDIENDFEQYKVPYTLNETFETGGGTSHISQCWYEDEDNTGETVYQVDEDDPGPSSFNGAIGWNGETAEGCDVIRPAFSFTLHKKLTADEMTSDYRMRLCRLTGSVNDRTYCGFSAGNLLLESVSGTSSAEYFEEDIVIENEGQENETITWPPRITYDLAFKFRGGMEFSDFNVAGVNVENKKAHQYLWVYYEKFDDPDVGVTLDYPKSVIVNDVYPSADFRGLNIYGELDE